MNIPHPANSNALPFALSRHAEMPRPIPRYRADRLYVPLERSEPLEPTWKSWANALGCVLFMVAVWAVL